MYLVRALFRIPYDTPKELPRQTALNVKLEERSDTEKSSRAQYGVDGGNVTLLLSEAGRESNRAGFGGIEREDKQDDACLTGSVQCVDVGACGQKC